MPQRPPRAPTPWKPPIWLLLVDTLGLFALGLGLLMQFAPESGVAQSLPPGARLPLLVFGGATFVLAWYAMIRMLLSARPRR